MEDRFGQELSGASFASAAEYVKGIDLLLTARPGSLAFFDKALEHDPGFVLGHAARARSLQAMGKVPEAQNAVRAAAALSESGTDRERSHVAVLERLVTGDSRGALNALMYHVSQWPRDALILSLTVGVYGLLGFSGAVDHHQQQRDLLDRIAVQWGEDWWFLAYRGWAHVETGNPAFGAELIDRSMEKHRINGNAAHARSHAFYESGDATAGMHFLEAWLPDYEEAGSLYPHLSWHLALFALREGRPDRALELFERRFRPALGKQPPFFAIVDAGAFNWRCQLRGISRPAEALEEVSAYATRHFSQPGVGFANVHAAYAWASDGKLTELEQHIEALDLLARNNSHPSAPTVLAICRGLLAFARKDYVSAAGWLESAVPLLPSIGGSHAQRDGVLETLVLACLRSGQHVTADNVLASRLGLKSIWPEPHALA